MKKLYRLFVMFFIVPICLFLFLCGMVLPSVEDLPANLERLNWRREESDIDLMNFPYVPISFAVNTEGYWAVAYEENIHHRLLLVAPDGSTNQYVFEAEGSWAMDIRGDELLIYLARSNIYFVANFLTGQWQERSYSSAEYGSSPQELKQRRMVQQGAYTITANTDWNSYCLELNGKQILRASPLAILLARLPYATPFLMPLLLFYAVRKNRKRFTISPDRIPKKNL